MLKVVIFTNITIYNVLGTFGRPQELPCPRLWAPKPSKGRSNVADFMFFWKGPDAHFGSQMTQFLVWKAFFILARRGFPKYAKYPKK